MRKIEKLIEDHKAGKLEFREYKPEQPQPQPTFGNYLAAMSLIGLCIAGGFWLFRGPDPADNCLDDQSAQIGAFVASQTFVERALRSPSTASFPRFTAQDVIVNFERPCHFKVAGYVDAENAFGTTVRTRYIIDMEADPEDGGYWGRNLLLD